MSTPHLLNEDYDRAERSLASRRQGCTFPGVRKALSWYYEMRQRLQSPHGQAPHTEPAPYRPDLGEKRSDTRVVVQVDGGKGGDIDLVYTTLFDIQRAINACRERVPQGMLALETILTSPVTQTALADRWKVPATTLSAAIGDAEKFLTGYLHHAEILR